MRTITRFSLAFLFAAVSGAACAQATAPSGLIELTEELSAASTVPPTTDGTRETRLPGARVTEIEVRSGGSTYYVQPQSATGGTRSGTVQWNVFNFDLNRRAGATQDSAPAMAPATVPPPPRAN